VAHAATPASSRLSNDYAAPEFMMAAARMPVVAHPVMGAPTVFGMADAIALCTPVFHPNHRRAWPSSWPL
jgi:hypothetical protein